MTWKGICPIVKLNQNVYEKGVAITSFGSTDLAGAYQTIVNAMETDLESLTKLKLHHLHLPL